MPVILSREGATPNLIKYSVTADKEGGDVVLTRDDLLRDMVKGPLRTYVERGVRIGSVDDACRYLLCNAKMRAFVTPMTLERVALSAETSAKVVGAVGDVALKITAEENAKAIVVLEFRHSMAA